MSPKASPAPKRKYKERRDKGTQRAQRDTRPCRVCGAPVTRSVSTFRERVYCGRPCFESDVSRIGKEKRAAGETWGRPLSDDAFIVKTSDGNKSAVLTDGYVNIYWPEHPLANKAGRVGQ